MSNFLINIFNTGEIVQTEIFPNVEECEVLWADYLTALENGCNAPYQIGVSSYSITPYDGPL